MIPSTMDLRGCFSGPPPVLGAGSRGSISAHCSPVKSEGYRRCRDTRPRTRVQRTAAPHPGHGVGKTTRRGTHPQSTTRTRRLNGKLRQRRRSGNSRRSQAGVSGFRCPGRG